jgi:UDP-glucuronate 4-epimerase
LTGYGEERVSVLVTGAAGFIGSHTVRRLLQRGEAVVGVDNLNDYYSVQLKRDRLSELQRGNFAGSYTFVHADFTDSDALRQSLKAHQIRRIVHLGAQAGVRYSLQNPRAYAMSNVVGHLNILEYARDIQSEQLVYASSSSVYGGNERLPFRVEDRTDHPVSLYAATKKADELMSETYAHLFRLPQTGLRFFTVYGPWGRPDMAPWVFTQAVLQGRPIDVYGEGNMRRDFTYVDDIVDGVVAALDRPPADDGTSKPGGSKAPHAVYNLGNNKSVELEHFIATIEGACGRRAVRNVLPMQQGDVRDTYADITDAGRDLGYCPTTSIEEGIPRFVSWFRRYHDHLGGHASLGEPAPQSGTATHSFARPATAQAPAPIAL